MNTEPWMVRLVCIVMTVSGVVIAGEDPDDRTDARYRKPADAGLRKTLTALQYKVTRENGTEPPVRHEFWNNKKPGIYVDIVSGEPLFSSTDKFKSGTGWPSFTRALVQENIVEKKDRSFFMTRTEVRSKHGDSHLGHVFTDGPEPTGLRYCINSAALRFVPASDLETEGYEEFSHLFTQANEEQELHSPQFSSKASTGVDARPRP